MNGLLWIAQMILAGVFLFTGYTKLFHYNQLKQMVERRSKGIAIGITSGQARAVGLAEIVGAIGVLLPVHIVRPHIAVLSACAMLAALMVGAGIYHLKREESAAPSVVMFLLALFVLVGRWWR